MCSQLLCVSNLHGRLDLHALTCSLVRLDLTLRHTYAGLERLDCSTCATLTRLDWPIYALTAPNSHLVLDSPSGEMVQVFLLVGRMREPGRDAWGRRVQEVERAEGTEIMWREGKNVTVHEVRKKKRARGGRGGRTVLRTVPCRSFFNFFATTSASPTDARPGPGPTDRPNHAATGRTGRSRSRSLEPAAEAVSTDDLPHDDGSDPHQRLFDDFEVKPSPLVFSVIAPPLPTLSPYS